MECAIREATSEDCELLMSLIQEIAAFHHILDDVKINSQVLKEDGFGKQPFFKCILADVPGEGGSRQVCTAGYALYFFGYNVNHGRILYLENLFVVSEFRGKGIGKQLLHKVAEIALNAGCTEIKFTTMEGNEFAKDFYMRLGAHDTTETEQWHCMVLEEKELQNLVHEGTAK